MRIGVVREIGPDERRVALTPAGAHALVRDGHEVLVERGAGEGSGLGDAQYAGAGARIVGVDEAWEAAELLVKVMEPGVEEYARLRGDLLLFAYLHLAADRPLTEALLAAGTTAIALETVATDDGRLPLLAPMSAVAGRLATQAGAHFLAAPAGGSGTLLGPVAGVTAARVIVVGGGVVGTNAAQVALGLGAHVTLFERSLERLDHLAQVLDGNVELAMAHPLDVEQAVANADLAVGAVLVPGARAPSVITRDAVAQMREGSVVCDVSIDQGGCVETSRPTTHSDPVFLEEGVLHYCVANIPGAVPRTSTRALANATLPYVRVLAASGEEALADHALARGLNVRAGSIVHDAVAEAFGRTEATAA